MIQCRLDLRRKRCLLRPKQKSDQKDKRSRSETDSCLSFVQEV